jgi:hypothetical protein
MLPYFAIIKDSFRAALASRVLYVLLILITLLLIVLAPLHVRETLDWKLVRQVNVRNGSQMISLLVKEREKKESVKRIWSLLPEDLQERLLAKIEPRTDSSQESEIPGQPKFVRDIELQDDLIKELNLIIERRDFYRKEDWSGRGLRAETRDLLEGGVDALTDIRVKRLNRLLVSTALAPHVDQGNPTALEIQYAVWKLPFPIQMTQQQFGQTLLTYLPWYFDKFVLSIGLLIAIIVTANMVPETFEPGSLNLLLSKPISRWGLFTAKFVGGCVFIGLCAAYLFVGLWLWLGWAMGVWDRAMLISIPLYIVVFAIYFSVSALVGLLYRSPIVSVILVLLFWVACSVVGTVYGVFRTKASNSEVLALIPAGERLFRCDLLHQVSVWDKTKLDWDQRQEAVLGQQEKMVLSVQAYAGSLRDEADLPGLKDFLRPVVEHRTNRILSSPLVFQFSSGAEKKLYAANVDEPKFKEIGLLPAETLKLFETPQGIVAVTGGGNFHRLNPERYEAAFNRSDSTDGSAGSGNAATKPEKPVKAEAVFDPIGPTEADYVRGKELVDYSYSRDEFAVYEYGKVRVYRNAGKSYELRDSSELKLNFNTNMTAMVGFGAQRILIAFGNGKVLALDADSLKQVDEYQLESRSGVREIACSPDGQYFGIMYRNGNLWILKEGPKSEFVKANVAGQGSISAFALGENGKCWINYDTDRVTQYDLKDGSREARLMPPGDLISQLYRWLIRPLYRVFPKPSEFYKVVSHLASNSDASSNQDVDWNKAKTEASDPWGPLRSGLVFMFGMLAIGCTVFHFKDY